MANALTALIRGLDGGTATWVVNVLMALTRGLKGGTATWETTALNDLIVGEATSGHTPV